MIEKQDIVSNPKQMPEQQSIIQVPGMDNQTILAISYGAFLRLEWPLQVAAPGIIVAYTIQTWNRYSQQINVVAKDGTCTVESIMIRNESFDISNRNKKNIAAFTDAFNHVKQSITEEKKVEYLQAIAKLEEETQQKLEQENKDAEEIDKVFHLSGSNLYATYSIIGINLLIFILMIIDGAGLFTPNGLVHIAWGSNFSPFTFSGDWWRLISAQFIHFGVIHILLNMYALFVVAFYLEPMLGKITYVGTYLCTGVFAGLASLWWHSEGVNGAGASGAIFGMYGVFLALLTTRMIPSKVRKGLLQSMLIFVAYNLVYGLKGGIDNAAHIGGLLSGLLIGYLLVPVLKKQNETGVKKIWPVWLIVLATVTSSYFFLLRGQISLMERKQLKEELGETRTYDPPSMIIIDSLALGWNKVGELEKEAIDPINDYKIATDSQKIILRTVSLPAWQQVESELDMMEQHAKSNNEKTKIVLMRSYVAKRREELELLLQLKQWPANDHIVYRYEQISKEIGWLIDAIDKL